MEKNREYFEFVDCLKKEVQHIIKDWEAEVIFRQANDSETKDYLLVEMPTKEGMGIQRFHVEEIFQDLKSERATMEEIAEAVRETLKMGYRVSGLGLFDMADNYEKIKDSLILRPLNFDANAEKLDKGVFYQIGNVALTLYINIGSMKNKYISSMVSSELLSIWEKKKEEVIEAAIRNTYRLFPPRILDAYLLYCGMPGEQEFMHTTPETVKNNRGEGIFVTTINRVNGAISIFMPGVAERLAELLGSDFYIGFLGTESAVIHNSSFITPDAIREALKYQESQCDCDDFLSGKVYFYSRERNRIEVIG
ncbi:DUF5688 family protein [Enterocloster bolteae]|uniref:DUF5688 family protein n=1 Tax=Enterocloster bolteae TaxID=208479 RepID=UPI0028DCE27F|nr:DUF5688 family protein [Enterocloster bolteae]